MVHSSLSAVMLLAAGCMAPLPSTLASSDGQWTIAAYTYERTMAGELEARFESEEEGRMWFTPDPEVDVEDGWGGAEWWEPVVVDDEERFLPIVESFRYTTYGDGTMTLTWEGGLADDVEGTEITITRVLLVSLPAEPSYSDPEVRRTWELVR